APHARAATHARSELPPRLRPRPGAAGHVPERARACRATARAALPDDRQGDRYRERSGSGGQDRAGDQTASGRARDLRAPRGAGGIVMLLVVRVLWSAWRLSGASPDRQRTATGTVGVRSSRAARAAARLPVPVTTAIGMRMALEPGRGRSAIPVRSALVGSAI